MSRVRTAMAVLLVGAATLAPSVVDAQGGGRHDHDRHQQRAERWAVKTVRWSTWEYRRVAAAEADGYGQFLTCAREPGVGAMGTHWVNGDLVGDTVLDPRRPEAIVYETRPNGKLRAVAVEYVVFKDAWDAEHSDVPELFGQQLHLVEAPNRYGLPSFYELHVWAWKNNPAGVFADWNPRVTCDHAVGDPI